MKVSRLFVLNSLLSAKRPGQTLELSALNGRLTAPAYNKRGIVFYIQKGTWGGGAGCMWGDTVD